MITVYLSSLQGPLVKRNSGGWSATEVVEYFHLLPYASIISTFFLRYLQFQLAFICGELSIDLAFIVIAAWLNMSFCLSYICLVSWYIKDFQSHYSFLLKLEYIWILLYLPL